MALKNLYFELSDTELGLVQELVSLSNAGFSLDQIREMMGPESFELAEAALEKASEGQEVRRPRAVRKGRVLKARKSWLEEHVGETEEEEDAQEPF
jgi:DNA-binding transcriptional MerR regulator